MADTFTYLLVFSTYFLSGFYKGTKPNYHSKLQNKVAFSSFSPPKSDSGSLLMFGFVASIATSTRSPALQPLIPIQYILTPTLPTQLTLVSLSVIVVYSMSAGSCYLEIGHIYLGAAQWLVQTMLASISLCRRSRCAR